MLVDGATVAIPHVEAMIRLDKPSDEVFDDIRRVCCGIVDGWSTLDPRTLSVSCSLSSNALSFWHRFSGWLSCCCKLDQDLRNPCDCLPCSFTAFKTAA